MARGPVERTKEEESDAEIEPVKSAESKADLESDAELEPSKSVAEKQVQNPLPRMEPLGPGDKEAARWNKEADEIEAWARSVPGGPEAHLKTLRQQMGWEATEKSTENTAGAKGSVANVAEGPKKAQGHPVPATTLETLDTLIDEQKAKQIAAAEHPDTKVADLPDGNLRGVAFEGMVSRHLEDTRDGSKVVKHPQGLKTEDGRRIEPDDVVLNKGGKPGEVVDAKAYTRKDTENPEASASSLTHMQNLRKAAKYADVDQPSVERVTFAMPRETASMPAVQDVVAELGKKGRPVSVEAVGDEAQIKQRAADLREEPKERFKLSGRVQAEVERIQSLPASERRDAMGEFVQSLQDGKGDETAEGRNLRWSTRVERDGKGITVIGEDGRESTVWYEDAESS